ncbi:hypothetical protein AAFC00_005582 [Neodothiora populina]|uniref:F-box domain-containing protein n=1 Tax=Neodothiora populina TaxID=2781224 RepID=A0ABR3PLD9_9PEZI
MAAHFPLEIQQHVFQYLDPRSFNASRAVCRWWRHASTDPVTLATQLQQVPITPSVSAKTLGSERLLSLFGEAAHTLMLGMRVTTPGSRSPLFTEKSIQAKLSISKNQKRAAALSDREITLWNLEAAQPEVISRRALNDLRTAIGGGPWFKCAPTTLYELALSDDGTLLAIALERTIQIYDLSAEEDSWPSSAYIPSAAGHYIAGLAFQHNNSLLRVQLSNKGTVVYLGSPQDSTPSLQHWQGKGGLRHAFLDSSKVVPRPFTTIPLSDALAGMKLLRPLNDGWLFAAQRRHPIAPSSCYCVGYIATPTMHGHFATAENSAVILADLPSPFSFSPTSRTRHGYWEDLYSEFTRQPDFSLSADGILLAMSADCSANSYERDDSNVAVYRLPRSEQLAAKLDQESCSDLKQKEQHRVQSSSEHQVHTISRLPMSLGTIKGRLLGFRFEESSSASGGRSYQLCATTETGSRHWSLLDS